MDEFSVTNDLSRAGGATGEAARQDPDAKEAAADAEAECEAGGEEDDNTETDETDDGGIEVIERTEIDFEAMD